MLPFLCGSITPKFVLHAQRNVPKRTLVSKGCGRSFPQFAPVIGARHAFQCRLVFTATSTWPRSFHSFVDQVTHVFFAAYICMDEFRFRTCLTDFTDEFLAVASSRRPAITT